jgi:uncharacterized protein
MTMDPRKPSENEEEYFQRLELERKKQWEKERAAKMQEGEKTKLKDLHFMKCPKCGMDLHTIDFKGFKIDRCVSCNGTWLDAGEMEQILEHEHPVLSRFKGIFG